MSAGHPSSHAGHEGNPDHEWWVKPRLRTDEDEGRERKTSWLELFYDLVFVVVVAQLSHRLSLHPTGEGVLELVLLFVPAWWLWIGGTFYTERFESEDVSHRLVTLLQMVPLALLAALAHDGLDHSASYALTYAAGRALIVVLWLRGGLHDRRAGPITHRYALGFTTSAALFAVSAFVAVPVRFQIWVVALTIDVVTPLFTMAQQRKLPRYSTSRLPERFGLFVLIVLGENVASVIAGVGESGLASRSLAAGGLGMALTFASWWIYFDLVQQRPAKYGMPFAFARSYLHLPLVLSLIATAAGVLTVIGHQRFGPDERWLLAGSVAAMFATLGLLHAVLATRSADARAERTLGLLLWMAALGAMGIGALGVDWGALRLLGALLGLHLVLIVYGATMWARGRLA